MTETVTNADACYAFDIVEAICTQIGPGLPGSSQERARAAVIAKELESHLGAGNVVVEQFAFAPGAFLGSLPLSALCMLLAAALNILVGRLTGVSACIAGITALVLSIASILVIVLEFILSLEFIDSFFKKKQSLNIVGSLKPGTGVVKRLLILSGHHDSALENTWLGLFGYGFFVFSATWFIGLVTLLAMSGIQLAGTITGNANLVGIGTLGWVLVAYPIVPSILYAMFFNRGRENGGTVPGAVDNLSASALVVAMCRFLAKNPSYVPADTEIRFISFGAEEAGLRGSRRYVARHLDELKRLDARLLNIEMVAHPEIAILTSEINGTVRCSPEMVKSVVAAAGRARVPHRTQSASSGASNDAGSFCRAGLKATTLLPLKIPQQMVTIYHQRRDTPKALSIEPLLNVLKLTLEWVHCGGE